jgi:hypothetical protein
VSLVPTSCSPRAEVPGADCPEWASRAACRMLASLPSGAPQFTEYRAPENWWSWAC